MTDRTEARLYILFLMALLVGIILSISAAGNPTNEITCPHNPGRSSLLIISPDGEFQLEDGERLVVARPDGTCVGTMIYEDAPQAQYATLYHNDWLTDEIDGLLPGDTLRFITNRGEFAPIYESPKPYYEEPPATEGRQVFRINGLFRVQETSTEPETPTPGFIVSWPYPNPTGGRATFYVTVPETQHVSIRLYNVLGQEVDVIAERELRSGERYEFQIDVLPGLPSGNYIYRVVGRSFVEAKTVTIIK